jgi:type VI secretion system protein ImpM
MPGGDVTMAAPAPGAPVTGLVGKLPAHGDFVRRGGPGAGLAQVDAWLDRELGGAVAAGIMLDAGVEALDGWRFATTGPEGPMIAVAIASGDGVGRVFPLVATLTGATTDRVAAEHWCAAAADALAGVRDAGQGADAALAALSAIEPPAGDGPAATGWWHPDPAATAGEAADLPSGAAFRSLLSRSEP